MPRKATGTKAKSGGRMPDYDLKVLCKSTGQTTYIGAGWKNDDGSICVKLDLCCTMPSDPDLVYTLFPATTTRGEKLDRMPKEDNRWNENPSS